MSMYWAIIFSVENPSRVAQAFLAPLGAFCRVRKPQQIRRETFLILDVVKKPGHRPRLPEAALSCCK